MVSWPLMYTPSVVVTPVRRPARRAACAISRVVVVLPLVPVTATTGMRPSSCAEQGVDDGVAGVARRAAARVLVHADAGRGIDFDDAAALLAQRQRDVVADDVDAGHVQADLARGAHADVARFLGQQVGHVFGGAAGGQVGVAAQVDADAGRGTSSRADSPGCASVSRPGRRARCGSGYWCGRRRAPGCGFRPRPVRGWSRRRRPSRWADGARRRRRRVRRRPARGSRGLRGSVRR